MIKFSRLSNVNFASNAGFCYVTSIYKTVNKYKQFTFVLFILFISLMAL